MHIMICTKVSSYWQSVLWAHNLRQYYRSWWYFDCCQSWARFLIPHCRYAKGITDKVKKECGGTWHAITRFCWKKKKKLVISLSSYSVLSCFAFPNNGLGIWLLLAQMFLLYKSLEMRCFLTSRCYSSKFSELTFSKLVNKIFIDVR